MNRENKLQFIKYLYISFYEKLYVNFNIKESLKNFSLLSFHGNIYVY